ncbi:Ankyrin repeat domain-containing protein 2B, partial [Durusdinium trenchii]
MATETLNVSDGTTMQIARLPDIDDETWAEVKDYVEKNPETAKALQNFAKNPEAMRGWLQTQAIAEHYNTKLSNGDTPVQDRVKSLESDAELGPIFEDIKKNGVEAAMKYYQDEELMLKISQKMGGLPSELSPVLQKIEDLCGNDTPMTLHEAAKRGDLTAVKTFLEKKKPLDSQDHKGVTALGYAIGANRIAVVKLLLDNRANPYAVDSSGNSGLHYA